jgi:hypothetical protein
MENQSIRRSYRVLRVASAFTFGILALGPIPLFAIRTIREALVHGG